jgi:hypothetical protein
VEADQAAAVNRSEKIMSTGNVLYLLMCIAMFTALSGTLAYQSWREGRPGPGPAPGDEGDIDHAPDHGAHL